MSIIGAFIEEELSNLPPLPDSVIRIQAICNDPDSALKDLADVVDKDPLLTANLLRLANSPYYGYAGRIKTVSHAISLFGMTTVLGFALTSAVRDSFKIDLSPYGLSAEGFASASQVRSSLMFHWFAGADRARANVLVPATFVDGIGKVVIATVVLRTQRGTAFREALEASEDPTAVEREFVEESAQEVTATMLERWGIDPQLTDVIRASDDPATASAELRPLSAPLKAARLCIGDDGNWNDASIARATQVLSDCGQDPEGFRTALNRLAAMSWGA